jgi:hypothetical protein
MNTFISSLRNFSAQSQTVTSPLVSPKKGSALLLTLMVASLLMVMVLSFVVFVRVELRTVINHQQLQQARANAKLGAEMAISRLQELAGADTRVTAPVLTSSSVEPNKLLIGQAVDAAAYLPTGSGGSVAYNPNYAKSLGYFISTDSASAFDPLSYWPFDGTGEVTTGNALLVGPGSVSDSKDDNSDGVPDGFVAAPLQSISSGSAGSYAWWASDDGLKAQINITDPYFEATNSFDSRAQAATSQRMGSEAVLENYDPASSTHNEILKRSYNLEQLNLISGNELGPEVARDYFHDVTLQSLGLPSNTKRGGLKRDLTAVFKETEANSGSVDATSGSQFSELLDYQADRITRYRAETIALAALGSQPAGLENRHWNALQALTLRQNQADSRFNDRIFPPMTDMHTQWDLGGANWANLMTWVTLRQRQETSNGVTPKRRWQENMNLSPVIAKINLSTYFTLDWPEAAMHMIPVVTLWNPYDVPLVMDPSRPWTVTLEMNSEDWVSKKLRFKVKHPRWSAPNESRYSHIVPKDELWTPPFFFDWDADEGSGLKKDFEFQIRDASGGTDLVIPPGEAYMFSMHEHEELNRNGGRLEVRVQLRAGLAPDGMYSFYAKQNFQDEIFEDGSYLDHDDNDTPDDPSDDKWRWKSGTDGEPDINQSVGPTYHLASGGYNEWHQTGTRMRSNDDSFYRTVDSLPYPFPLNTNILVNVNQINNMSKFVPPADIDICINENGLNGDWEILEMGAETGRPAQEGSNYRNMRFQLYESGSENYPLVDVMHPNQNMPKAIHFARVEDSPGTSGGPSITPIWVPEGIPADNEPFTPATRGFPAWGHSFGLRLPDHSYVFDDTTDQGAAVAAPIRWLVDFNPLFPFPNRDPSSRMQQAGGWRNNRRGFKSTPMYVGGFFMGDSRFADLSWNTPNDLNQFIGHSDDTLTGYSPGDVPKAILIEVPDNSEDIVSVASLTHAPLVSTYHALHPSDPAALPGSSIGDRNNKQAVTYSIAYWTGHPGFAQPTYMIGNSESHFLVSRERAEQSFYPHPSVPNPSESIPYLTNKGPADMSNGSETYLAMYDFSWIYNEVLWDDFLFTPDSNSRIQWQNGSASTNRDFNQSSERMMVNGAFNINSTSIPAWAAMLSSMMNVDVGGGDATSGSSAFSRFITAPGPAFEAGNDDYTSKTAYLGYRRLTPDQIWDDNGTPNDRSDDAGLAVEIVEQVKQRGPFLSLSDFVNRALISEADDTLNLGKSGALQSAIEIAGLNDDMGTSSEDKPWVDGASEYPTSNAFFELNPSNATGRSNQGAPGTLMQADILSRIGSVLQARSDTFTIRAQGILGDTDNPTARAWCEVTVQRDPDFIDDTNSPGELPVNLSPINIAFGRKFRILSFRWLSAEEI